MARTIRCSILRPTQQHREHLHAKTQQLSCYLLRWSARSWLHLHSSGARRPEIVCIARSADEETNGVLRQPREWAPLCHVFIVSGLTAHGPAHPGLPNARENTGARQTDRTRREQPAALGANRRFAKELTAATADRARTPCANCPSCQSVAGQTDSYFQKKPFDAF